ncbi:hypothetical protein FB446DRAFT_793680 [Lentinula raphanica]|nr:hypothetical protein FB446DRAFT_793680 [Lentinula raphanica]
MFYFRTIHLVLFGLILIGAVNAVPMPPSGTTSNSPSPEPLVLVPSREGPGDPLEYQNDLDIVKRKSDSRYNVYTDYMIQRETCTMQQEAYEKSGWIHVIIDFNPRTDSPKPIKLRTIKNRLLKWSKGFLAPSENLMLKEKAGVSEEKESMLRESIQRWSGREVPWDKALGVQITYGERLEPGMDGFDYYVSWVAGEPPRNRAYYL